MIWKYIKKKLFLFPSLIVNLASQPAKQLQIEVTSSQAANIDL